MSEANPGPEKPPPTPALGESLFGRAAALWIWSIFFGLNGGLSYSLLHYGSGTGLGAAQFEMMLMGTMRNRPGLGMPPAAAEIGMIVTPLAVTIGLLASITAWLFLYFYFTGYVVPVVLLNTPVPNDQRRRRTAALMLARVYQLLILAALARFTPELVALVLPALARYGLL